MQLLCFTYAGGKSDFYEKLQENLGCDIRVIALDYPGHGKRRNEKLLNDIDELGKDMFEQLQSVCNFKEPYGIFGYSMGCIVSLCLYDIICKNGLNLPQHIFLAAHFPHTNKLYLKFNDSAYEDELKNHIGKFGGIPEKLLNNSAFWRMYLPMYRDDFYAIGTYDFEKRKPVIDTSATIFYSESDTPYQDMKEWKRFLIAGTQYVRFEGNHFFMNEHCEEISEIIRRKLL